MSVEVEAAVTPDIVASWAEVAPSQEPLLVIEGLERAIPGSGPIEATRLGTGHSNETFEVRRDGRSYVLRRPPRGPLPPTAHDVVREARIMELLADRGVIVPRPRFASSDSGLIGAPFFVMDYVEGSVIRDRMPPELDDPAGRRGAVFAFVDAVAAVHAIEWRGTPLEKIGKPSGYLDRQLRRWKGQWEHNRTRPIEQIERIGEWLERGLPADPATTIVHGDAKLDNALFAPGAPPRIAALVDWEMATLGDPLADLGLLTGTYVEPGEEPDPVFGFSSATTAPGSPTRAEIAGRYAERSGRDVSTLLWYEVLAIWKIMVLLEGSYKRFLAGTTADPFFARLEQGIPRMATLTLERVAGSGA